jgi:universal stress protein E
LTPSLPETDAMKPIRKILVAADPTEASELSAQPAVGRALRLARQLDAELQVFIVADYNEYLEDCRRLDPASLARAQQEYVARKRAWLEEIANSLDAADVRASVDLAWDRPLHEGITRQVLRYEPDLVLKDTHHHSAMDRALFTNTDWHLIRECPAPLLLVRADRWPAQIKVLAAVDPLHENDKPAALDRKILDTAEHFARSLGGELHVLHACETLDTAGTLGGVYLPVAVQRDEINEKLQAAHRSALEALIAGRGIAAQRVHLRAGRPRSEMLATARALPATLVVMGAVARSGLQRVFVGSTAERVLEALPCDVLIVKPDGFRTPVEL